MFKRLLRSAFGVVSMLMVSQSSAQDKVVAYVPNWIDLKAFAETIDYAKLTHINIAFENPTDASGRLSFNQKNITLIAKARANKVKVMVSMAEARLPATR